MAGFWYRAGTVSVTNGSKKIVGSGTLFKTTTFKPDKGHAFYGPDGKVYEIDYVESDTVLYLVKAYTGATASGQSYEIDITRTSTIPALSREISSQLAYAQGQYDSWQQILTGADDVTLTAPDARQITVPALSNILSKSGNLAGLADKRAARVNLGLTAGSGASADDDINVATRLLRWMNYGSGHTIFDASKGISPGNTPVNNVNAAVGWSPDKPCFMGWNGVQTFGVRVDSARIADSVADLATAQIQPRSRTVVTQATAHWYLLGRFEPSSGGTLGTLHVRGYIGPWSGAKGHIDLTIKNREGVYVTGYGTGLLDIRVQDLGFGYNEVWVYMPTYYVAELEVFATGNGLTGWLFGDVVTDMPNGTTMWSGAQSMPLMLTSRDQVSGSWDPVISGVSDFTQRNATYIRIGRQVTVRCYLSFIGKTVPANAGVLAGLPFVPKSMIGAGYIPCAIYRAFTSAAAVNAYIPDGAAQIVLSNAATRESLPFETGADYMFSATYEIA
jgi:hypothetical protein